MKQALEKAIWNIDINTDTYQLQLAYCTSIHDEHVVQFCIVFYIEVDVRVKYRESKENYNSYCIVYSRGVELPHSESRTSRAPGQPVPPLIFLLELHETRQGESAVSGGEIHQSEVGVEGAVLLRLYEAGEEENEPLRLANRLFDTPGV